MKNFLLATAAIVSFGAASSAWAATQSTTMGATASVTTICSMDATPLSFGEMALSGTKDGIATVNVTCTNGGTYDVGLDDGVNAVGSVRNLKSGTDVLAYDLFKEVGHTNRWGVGAEAVAGVGNGAVQPLTVYGQIATGQILTTGDYTDTVQVTVTY